MKRTFALILLATGLIVAGCSKPQDDVADGSKTGDDPAAKTGDSEIAAKGHGAHGGWWCTEHGIPEEECSMCSAKAADKFKKAGDWCEKHNRAESQCFICNPERREHYAAVYRAKFGKEPPKPGE